MKFSKVMASAAALTMVASMAIPVSAASEAYMFTPTKSWNGKCPTDATENPVKFQFNEDGTEVLAKGAADFNHWNSGPVKYNGAWCQYVLTDNDLSGLSIDFTIDFTDATTVEWHTDDPEKSDEENVYEVFLALAGGKKFTEAHNTINEGLGEHEDSEFVNTGVKSFTYTLSAEDIQAAVDGTAGTAELKENGDGTYNLGFNIQVGHFTDVEVTAVIKSSTGNLYEGPAAEGDTSSSAAPTDSSSKKADDESSKKADDSSKSTTSAANNAGGTTKTTGTTSAAGGGSDATDKTAATGATAGLVFAGIALAGAALVVTKRK